MIHSIAIAILQKLGSGEFGTVHLGLWSNGSIDPAQVAVKTLNSESDRVKFLREAAIMGQFEDNYIVRLFGVVLEKQNIMMIVIRQNINTVFIIASALGISISSF